jgi:5-(carboxyamino)imidazole ribonucleotide mutase
MPEPLVSVVMGSESDWDIMSAAVAVLDEFGIRSEYRVISAHRTPDLLWTYARAARGRGLKAIIAGAGGAAHLPGMLAALTTVPILGVPVVSHGSTLGGLDALLSIAQMPCGVPVATFGINGAANAALFAVAMLADDTPDLAARLFDRRSREELKVKAAGLKFDRQNVIDRRSVSSNSHL